MFKAKELLEAHGHQVAPFATDYYENEDTEYSVYFCKFYDVSKEALSKPFSENLQAVMNMFFNREAYRKIKELIIKTKPDIVQGFNIPRNLSFSVFKAARDMGVPTILRLSDYALLCPCSTGVDGRGELCSEFSCTRFNYAKILMRRCVHNSVLASLFGCLDVQVIFLLRAYQKYVDYFIAPSQFIRNIFIQYYKIPPERIFYLPIFINSSNASLPDSDDGFFLYAGRLSKEKGITTLLQAIKKNGKRKLIIAGTGPLEAEYKDYCVKNKISNVEFPGFKNYAEIEDLIRRCRAVILPSEGYENSPNIILEAYRNSKPVIASRIGGIPELVKEWTTGLLFEPKDTDELSSKIEFLAAHQTEASRMGYKGHMLIEQEFNVEDHYIRLMGIYKQTLERNAVALPR